MQETGKFPDGIEHDAIHVHGGQGEKCGVSLELFHIWVFWLSYTYDLPKKLCHLSSW
jgi:hypothetical protein